MYSKKYIKFYLLVLMYIYIYIYILDIANYHVTFQTYLCLVDCLCNHAPLNSIYAHKDGVLRVGDLNLSTII